MGFDVAIEEEGLVSTIVVRGKPLSSISVLTRFSSECKGSA
jgi:hypothetical protein